MALGHTLAHVLEERGLAPVARVGAALRRVKAGEGHITLEKCAPGNSFVLLAHRFVVSMLLEVGENRFHLLVVRVEERVIGVEMSEPDTGVFLEVQVESLHF